MMLSLYDWSEPIRFPENQIQVLVIEHHRHFRRILELFLYGLHGEEVELHLTDTKLHLLSPETQNAKKRHAKRKK